MSQTHTDEQRHQAEPQHPAERRPCIGIVVGSIRRGRKGRAVGDWVMRGAARRDDARFRLIDLIDYELPLLTDETVPGAANRQYDSEQRRRWGRDIDVCDAYVFVTAEYNHGVPGAFKNAFDCLGPEWQEKPVGFVSYGAEKGVRSVEQWRQIVATFGMAGARAQVAISTFEEFERDGSFAPSERRAKQLDTLLDELIRRLS